jgi:hypothetical protein
MATIVKLQKIENATGEQKAFIENVCKLLNRVFEDETGLVNAIKAKEYKQARYKKFGKNPGAINMSKEGIVQVILEGREAAQQDAEKADRVIDLEVKLYPHRKGTVGSTTLGKQPIKPAFWFIERCMSSEKKDGVSMARHLMHEWCHVAGFFHYPDNSARGDVPYVIGDVFRERIKALNKAQLDKDLQEISSENELTAYLWEEGEIEFEFDSE